MKDKNFDYRQGNPIIKLDKIRARCIIMGRYGMLNCARNYKTKYKTDICPKCDKMDDENHCINECPKWGNVNRYGRQDKIDFNKIYTDDAGELMIIADEIHKIWQIEYGKNEIRKGPREEQIE